VKKLFEKFTVISLILCVTLGFGADIEEPMAKSIPDVSSNKQVFANTVSVDLTPDLKMKFALGGYGDRMSKPAEAVHDRIWAKALVLKQENKKYAIITLDVLGLPSNVKPELVKTLSSFGWNMENIMLLPSHSHTSLDLAAINDKNVLNSPQIGIFQPELLAFVIDVLSNLIKEADKDYKAVKIGTSSILIPNMNRNRRGDPEVDNELTLTRIDYENGTPMTALVNWTAHPTFMSGEDMMVSGGWPGFLQRELEQWIGNGITVMYYNGAEGDQSPIGQGGGSSHYEKAEVYGRGVAIKALRVYQKTKTRSKVKFEYNQTVVKLPKRKVHPSFMETGGEEYNLTPEVLDIVLGVMSPENTHICALRIGDLLMVGAPGEMAAGLGLKIKKQLKEKGIEHPTIGGLANEWISYILSADQYNNGGGYESSVSFYGDGLGKVIVEGMLNTSLPLTD
jgi:neutral/alkaline ceramidase-like enzyme